MTDGIVRYGGYPIYEIKTHKQRYWIWIYHRTGLQAGERWYKRRQWKTVTRRTKMVTTGRFEFHGPGRDLYRAAIESYHRVPRGPERHVKVSTEEFLKDKERYSVEGQWEWTEVESR